MCPLGLSFQVKKIKYKLNLDKIYFKSIQITSNTKASEYQITKNDYFKLYLTPKCEGLAETRSSKSQTWKQENNNKKRTRKWK